MFFLDAFMSSLPVENCHFHFTLTHSDPVFKEGCNAKVFYVTKIILWHRSPDDWEVEELKLQQFNPANQQKIYYNFEPVKKNKAFSKLTLEKNGKKSAKIWRFSECNIIFRAQSKI